MNKTIMTIEDAAFMSAMMKSIFKNAGYEVVAQAINGKDGVEKFQAFRPEIVVLNIVMPVMDGLRALEEIMKIEPSAKVVMCSALGQLDKVLLSLLNGASSFIVKPFQAETLLSVVESVIIEKPVLNKKTVESCFEYDEAKRFIERKLFLTQDSVLNLIEACKQDNISNMDFLLGNP